MKLFISWSGEKSREVALALRDWLPGVINNVDPFVSSKDIDPGARWQAEVAGQLEQTNYGIICLTRENQAARWLNFEAGALAKAVEASRVVPLAIDLKPSDIEPPLGHFQAQPATKEGIQTIVQAVNAACESSLDAELLERSFSKWWPELADRLETIENAAPAPVGDARNERELIEETLELVRSLARGSIEPFYGPNVFGHVEGGAGKEVPRIRYIDAETNDQLRKYWDLLAFHQPTKSRGDSDQQQDTDDRRDEEAGNG
jgi:TIR domain